MLGGNGGASGREEGREQKWRDTARSVAKHEFLLTCGARRGVQDAVQPPSTNSSVPVMYEASSLAANAITFATSSDRPIRPIGV